MNKCQLVSNPRTLLNEAKGILSLFGWVYDLRLNVSDTIWPRGRGIIINNVLKLKTGNKMELRSKIYKSGRQIFSVGMGNRESESFWFLSLYSLALEYMCFYDVASMMLRKMARFLCHGDSGTLSSFHTLRYLEITMPLACDSYIWNLGGMYTDLIFGNTGFLL